MAEGNAEIIIKDVPSREPLRLFGGREEQEVKFPIISSEEFDNSIESVTITPMTHRQAEIRKRLQEEITRAKDRSNFDAGVNQNDVIKYLTEYQTALSIDDDTKRDTKLAKLNDKYSTLLPKLNSADKREVYVAEDELLDHARSVVISNCKSINFKDGTNVQLTEQNIDNLHIDVFSWVIDKIDDISYLTDSDILGLA